MRSLYDIFDRCIELIENILCACPMAVILVVEAAQVFYRYVLRSGLVWSDEVITNLLVVAVMFGGARGIRHKEHTELTGTADALPKSLRITTRVITTLATLFFLGVLVWTSITFASTTGRLRTTYLKIPMKWCYMALPVGGLFMLYEFLKTVKYRITRKVIDVYDPEQYKSREDEI